MLLNSISSSQFRHTSGVIKTKKNPFISYENTDKISFSSNNIKVLKYKNIEIVQKAGKIVESLKNNEFKLLGNGADGNVYLINNPQIHSEKLIVKVSHTTNIDKNGNMQRVGVDFNNEADILLSLPEHNGIQKIKGQKGLLHFSDGERHYLVATFAPGATANPKNGIFLEKEHLKSIIDSSLELDKAGILHRDLKKENWFVDADKNINIIDYGSGTKFNHTDFQTNSNNHNFYKLIVPTNLKSFEDTGLFPYLQELSEVKTDKEVRNVFTDYLKLKSDFHEKRVEFLSSLNSSDDNMKKAIDYEKLQAKLLKNPSDEIVDLEAQKIQMTYSNEEAYKNEVLFINPLAAVSNKLFSSISANKFLTKVDSLMNRPQSIEMQEYLKSQKEIGEYFLGNKISKWTAGLFDWVMTNVTKKADALQPDLEKAGIENFKINNVSEKIINGK